MLWNFPTESQSQMTFFMIFLSYIKMVLCFAAIGCELESCVWKFFFVGVNWKLIEHFFVFSVIFQFSKIFHVENY